MAHVVLGLLSLESIMPVQDALKDALKDDLGPLAVLYKVADTALSAAETFLPLAFIGDVVEIVNWREPFMVAIFLFHAMVLAAVFRTRKNALFQCCLFVVLSALIFSSRTLNSVGKRNWRVFASQDYFDTHGLFISIFFSGPLLVVENIIFVSIHRQCLNKASWIDPAVARTLTAECVWFALRCYVNFQINYFTRSFRPLPRPVHSNGRSQRVTRTSDKNR